MNKIDKIKKYIREEIYSILENSNIELEAQKEISPEERERLAQVAKERARKQAYQRFYSQVLAKFGVSSVKSLPDDKKKEFFDFIEQNWTSKQEATPNESLSEIVQKVEVDGKVYDANVFYDDESANYFMKHNPGWGVIKVDGKRTGNPAYDRDYRVYVAKNSDLGIKETSATGGVAGYETPGAFTGQKGISKKQRSIANQLGYELVDKSYAIKDQGDTGDLNETLKEGFDSFYFKDENLTNEQKLGLAIRSIRTNLMEVEKVVNKAIKLKTENNINTDALGKRAYSSLRRINEKVIRLMVALNGLK